MNQNEFLKHAFELGVAQATQGADPAMVKEAFLGKALWSMGKGALKGLGSLVGLGEAGPIMRTISRPFKFLSGGKGRTGLFKHFAPDTHTQAMGFGLLSGGMNAMSAEEGDRMRSFGRGFVGGALGGAAFGGAQGLARAGMQSKWLGKYAPGMSKSFQGAAANAEKMKALESGFKKVDPKFSWTPELRAQHGVSTMGDIWKNPALKPGQSAAQIAGRVGMGVLPLAAGVGVQMGTGNATDAVARKIFPETSPNPGGWGGYAQRQLGYGMTPGGEYGTY